MGNDSKNTPPEVKLNLSDIPGLVKAYGGGGQFSKDEHDISYLRNLAAVQEGIDVIPGSTVKHTPLPNCMVDYYYDVTPKPEVTIVFAADDKKDQESLALLKRYFPGIHKKIEGMKNGANRIPEITRGLLKEWLPDEGITKGAYQNAESYLAVAENAAPRKACADVARPLIPVLEAQVLEQLKLLKNPPLRTTPQLIGAEIQTAAQACNELTINGKLYNPHCAVAKKIETAANALLNQAVSIEAVLPGEKPPQLPHSKANVPAKTLPR